MTELENVFAGIDVNTVATNPEPEDIANEVWTVVPNRRTRRNYSRLHGCEQPLRSRISRKRGR